MTAQPSSMNRILSPAALARHRIVISQAAGICLLVFAKPGLRWLFLPGVCIALAGEAVRLWAASTIKKNRELAREGPYALVRHPLYLGSFLILAGFCLAVANPAYWLRTALLWAFALGSFAWMYDHKMADEDARLSELFGDDFERYRRSTPRFFPRPAHLSPRWKDAELDPSLALKNREHHAVLGILLAASFLWMRLIYGA